MRKKKRSWKRWGGAGFLLTGTAFTITIALGGGPLLNHFALVPQIFIGVAGSLASCCLMSSIVAIRNCSIKEPDKEKLVDVAMTIASDSYTREKSINTTTILDILGSDFDMQKHAIDCNKLIEEYINDERDPEKDLSIYVNRARKLQEEFNADPERKKQNYSILLKKYGYKYDQPPTSKIKLTKLNLARTAPSASEYLDDSPIGKASPSSMSPAPGRKGYVSHVDRSDVNRSTQKTKSLTRKLRTP